MRCAWATDVVSDVRKRIKCCCDRGELDRDFEGGIHLEGAVCVYLRDRQHTKQNKNVTEAGYRPAFKVERDSDEITEGQDGGRED